MANTMTDISRTGIDTRKFPDCYTPNDDALYILLLAMDQYTIDVRSCIIVR